MRQEEAIIVGGGPCGLAVAIALQEIGMKPIIIEKGNIVNSIFNYPTHQTFFSSSEKLAVGDVPFIIEGQKPLRNQALVYYREVVKLKKLKINRFEHVEQVTKNEGIFTVKTTKDTYETPYVIIATGYYDHPNYMNIPGENLNKVMHYFKEGHPYFDTNVLIVGGKNSAIDAGLALHKAGAHVTVVYRGEDYSPSIKPWVLPDFAALAKNGDVSMRFNTSLKEVKAHEVTIVENGVEKVLANDFVFAMTGYHPNHQFIRDMGVNVDEESGRPEFDPETMETNVEGLFIAGVIAAGNNANEIFIENGRFHGGQIAAAIDLKA